MNTIHTVHNPYTLQYTTIQTNTYTHLHIHIRIHIHTNKQNPYLWKPRLALTAVMMAIVVAINASTHQSEVQCQNHLCKT